MERAAREMAARLAAFFEAQKGKILGPMLRAFGGKSAKALGDGLTAEELAAEVARLLDLLDTTPFGDLPPELQPILEGIAKDGAVTALEQVGASGIREALDAMDARAVEWAAERAAELVGMKLVDGVLVENPNAEWAISNATRELVRGDVTRALREGWSNDRLAASLEQSGAFSSQRAEMIARTETAFADAAANQAAWQASGVVSGKEWLLAEAPCAICEANAAAGVIPLEAAFPSGDTEEPAHPNCECVTVPVLKE